jgi:putative effector of murein hydrolase LrgA (UPF0299 family)
MMSNYLLYSLLQLFVATLAFAAPVAKTTTDNPMTYGTSGGIIGLIVLILDIIVFIEVLKSNRPPASKLLWCLVVFLFPIIGMVIYYLFSNRSAHSSGSYEPLP